ncbi:MAG TPA: transposase [Burkholderiaceae bacterium]|nr:transposase [Burkholderiaceae bacterium]
MLRGHDGQPIAADDADRLSLLAALREAALAERVSVHAYALLDSELHALATPPEAAALSRWLQGFGRRYVAAFNRRHARQGTLWAGRFHASVVDPAWLLDAIVHVERLPVQAQLVDTAGAWAWSSAAAHVGQRRDALLSDHPAYWQLGNTPFERELAHAHRLTEGVSPDLAARFDEAVRRGRAVGNPAFVAALSDQLGRSIVSRSRGRPRRIVSE